MTLPAEIARVDDFAAFGEDPLAVLERARAAHGSICALRDDGPVFSRGAECTGVVAVFGVAATRTVLADLETFGMPRSAARQLELPAPLVNLTRGLHSMRGDEHASERRAVASVLAAGLAETRAVAHHVLEASAWRPGATFGLLARMRALARDLAARLLFGAEHSRSTTLVALLEAHFFARREASAPGGTGRDDLLALGTALDGELRAYLRACDGSDGIFARLARAGLAEDAVVAHCNVLFVSATEPIAIALTWTLLVLSQLPALRRELRTALATAPDQRCALLERVLAECLRLLPPNAMMVRVTTQPVEVAGHMLPAACEVVLCPFLEHRNAEAFPDPARFSPARWLTSRPSPFEYLPFGAGGHACVGRALANALLTAVLEYLVPRFELVLAGDQEIDWRIHIQFMPRVDPIVRIHSSGARRREGRLCGVVGALLDLERGT